MWAPVVQGVNSIPVIDDQDRSMRPTYYEPPFALELHKRACTYEFGDQDHASSCSSAANSIPSEF